MIELRFDTPDNAATSLRIIAEHVRAGDAIMVASTVLAGGVSLAVAYHDENALKAGREEVSHGSRRTQF